MTTPGTLYLIPSTLNSEIPGSAVLPITALQRISHLSHFLVEDERSARRFLATCNLQTPIQQCTFEHIGKHSEVVSCKALLQPLTTGIDLGLLSEAGCPGVADPGQLIVAAAQQLNYYVVPLIGPSSILLALMASGGTGQHFTFHGYLPIDNGERKETLRTLELEAIGGTTQIWIESPHRNEQMLSDIIATCKDSTLLTLAINLTSSHERVQTAPVATWKQQPPAIKKIPTVFLFPARPTT